MLKRGYYKVMSDISVTISLSSSLSTTITPYTDLMSLKSQGINIINDDPDDCIISRKIYQTIFPFFDEKNCRGETLNTYNSTFGKDNGRLMEILDKENVTGKCKENILIKAESFKHTYLSIGNFTVSERGRNSINCSRGMGVLHDSWPLTLLCIQDYLSGYSKLEKNPLRESFDANENTINFFKRYSSVKNGFELFCNDYYFNPQLYGNNKEATYVQEDKNGNYVVNLDLFDGLGFDGLGHWKSLPDSLIEIEQYIERATIKIFERGKVLIKEYSKKLNN
jgi:hypothetical protein